MKESIVQRPLVQMLCGCYDAEDECKLCVDVHKYLHKANIVISGHHCSQE